MDYLPIQASAVLSECIFSSGGETDTNKRNRINPALMKALQMLKFCYKKEAQGKDSIKKLDNLFCRLAKDDEDDALNQNVSSRLKAAIPRMSVD
ncbi:hypothetical protein C8R48DRAFT_778102 [Suillus tomentosus]|nr:hypothetical protein C8R48DRAFT_778102 [Suillus tomentosus]